MPWGEFWSRLGQLSLFALLAIVFVAALGAVILGIIEVGKDLEAKRKDR